MAKQSKSMGRQQTLNFKNPEPLSDSELIHAIESVVGLSDSELYLILSAYEQRQKARSILLSAPGLLDTSNIIYVAEVPSFTSRSKRASNDLVQCFSVLPSINGGKKFCLKLLRDLKRKICDEWELCKKLEAFHGSFDTIVPVLLLPLIRHIKPDITAEEAQAIAAALWLAISTGSKWLCKCSDRENEKLKKLAHELREAKKREGELKKKQREK